MKRIMILLMAAGQSSRMGQNKLLLPFEGQSILRRTATTLIENDFKNIIVVTGHESARAHAALKRMPVEWVHNSDHRSGLLSSLQAGLRACDETIDAVMVVLADQVFLNPHHVQALIEFYEQAPRSLTAPRYGDERGHPVIIPREYFQQVLDRKESPEKGAQFLFQIYPEAVRMLNFPPGKESEDLDTPEDYTKLTQVESDLERKTGSEFDSQSAHADVQQDVQQDMRQELQRYVQQGVQLKEQQELQRELSYQNLQNQREGYS